MKKCRRFLALLLALSILVSLSLITVADDADVHDITSHVTVTNMRINNLFPPYVEITDGATFEQYAYMANIAWSVNTEIKTGDYFLIDVNFGSPLYNANGTTPIAHNGAVVGRVY